MHNIFATGASKYGHLNWAIFPLAAGSKVPIAGTAGIKEASADRAQIAVWQKQYPHANIALLCGPESGVIVIDIDDRSGGHETVERLATEGKVFPDTVEASTAGGGRHLFYAYDARVAVSGSNKLGKGVDVLTNDHACVLAPSYSAKQRRSYRWVRPPLGTDLPKLPKWVVETLKPKPTPKLRPMPKIDYANLQGYRRQAMADLDEAIRRIAGLSDGRHEAPFKVGASLGVYVVHGVLDRTMLEDSVMAACERNGALRKYRHTDLRKQIQNGLERATTDELPRLARVHRPANAQGP